VVSRAHDNFAAQFLRSRGSFVGSRCDPAARDFESIRRENGFTLIFVKTRHGCVLFRMKTPNVQPVRNALHSDAGGAQLQKYSRAGIRLGVAWQADERCFLGLFSTIGSQA
jgi:hypothetical protein